MSTPERAAVQGCSECGTVAATFVSSMTTAMWNPPFRDEEGRTHHHDTNNTTTTWRCPNGHTYATSSHPSCWCGWGLDG